jgi:hypothetical protein
MIHLESFQKSDYYQKITGNELNRLVGFGADSSDPFGTFYEEEISQEEFRKVQSLFQSWMPFKCKLSVEKNHEYNREIFKIRIKSNPLNRTFNWDITINKVRDEWWIVDVDGISSTKGPKDMYDRKIHTRDYFKCDQIEGLLKFLEDKIINFSLDELTKRGSKSTDMYQSIGEKRIQLFEEYSEPLYYDLEEYRDEDIIGDTDESKWVRYVEFDDIEKVKELFSKYKSKKKITNPRIVEDTSYIDLDYQQIKYPIKSLAISGITYKHMPDFISANILKAEDEWYYIEYFEFEHDESTLQRRFKCDQFDGLEACLNDLGIIEIKNIP